MLSDEQRRFANSDAGRALLQDAAWYREGRHMPLGNVNYSMVLQAIDWGWIAKGGITKAGRKALNYRTMSAAS